MPSGTRYSACTCLFLVKQTFNLFETANKDSMPTGMCLVVFGGIFAQFDGLSGFHRKLFWPIVSPFLMEQIKKAPAQLKLQSFMKNPQDACRLIPYKKE